jgi:hypothetical protein
MGNGHLSHNATAPSRAHRLAVDSNNIRQRQARVGTRASWLINELKVALNRGEIRARLIGLAQRQRVVGIIISARLGLDRGKWSKLRETDEGEPI